MRQSKGFWYKTICLFSGFCSLFSCQKNGVEKTSRLKPEKVIASSFVDPGGQLKRIESLHFSSDTVYLLTENLTRESGEQLIVDPGTIIKSNPGVGIAINSGGRIELNGTIDRPVVFTSNLPPGSKNNYWRGISITGKSVGAQQPNGDPNDNSGILKFARIEFGGLQLNSVGASTILDHVQSSYTNFSSGFEFNGGTVEGKYLVSYACNSSADFYIGNGYSGKLQFLLAYRHPFFGVSNSYPFNCISGLFIESGPVNPFYTPSNLPTISNLSVIGPAGRDGTSSIYYDSSNSVHAAAMVTGNNAGFKIRNSVFLGYPVNGWKITDSFTARKVHYLESEFTHSMMYCADTSRAFYIRPRLYRKYDFRDFKEYMLETRFNNRLIYSINNFGFKNLFSYEVNGPIPAERSIMLESAAFDGADYSVPFFDKVPFVGAVGANNWLERWTNFNPLKTRYNLPE